MSAPALPFVGADELRAKAPAEPAWCWNGYVAPGALTLLAGKPKAGKSTLAFALAVAVASCAPSFLGRGIAGGPVVYVSEEATGTLAHKLEPIPDVRVLTRDAAWPKPSWPELVAGSLEEAERVGAVLLIVDTWPYWSDLPRDAEKDAGAAQAAMRPLLDATRQLPVWVNLHQRKGGGEDGESVRGSGAIAGVADVVLELERGQRATERLLLALSRYPTTPGSLVLDHDRHTGAWRAIVEGERSGVRELRDRQAILDALSGGDELTRAELEEATGSPERQWHGALDELLRGGEVRKTGAGKKGDPYRFGMVRTDAAQTGAQNRAESDSADASVSSAHPHRGCSRNQAGAAASPNGARCAESTTDLQQRMRSVTSEGDWQQLEREMMG